MTDAGAVPDRSRPEAATSAADPSRSSSGARLRASVVIPTFGPPASLRRTLRHLSRQTVSRDDTEVIVVDNNRDGSISAQTAAVVREFGCTYVAERQPGAGAARNAGILAARAPVVIFLDDDMVVKPEFVAAHLGAHGDGNPRAVVGPIDHRDSQGTRFGQFLDSRSVMNREPDPLATDFRNFYGANSSVDRTTLVEVGLFDPSFVRRQDGELGFRLWHHGTEITVATDARSEHDPTIRPGAYFRRCRRDGYYLAKLCDKHPEIAEIEHLDIYRGWRPVIAGLIALPLIGIGWILYPISRRPLFTGWRALALFQSARGYRSFHRGRGTA